MALFSGGTLLGLGLTFASGVVAARWLGPTAYGELSVVRSVYALLAIVAPLGLDVALLRHLGASGSDRAEGLAQVRLFRLVALGANGALLLLAALWLGPWLGANVYRDPGFAALLTVALLGLPFAADAAILSATLRALGAVSLQNLAVLILQPILRTALMLAFLALGFGQAGVLIATIAGAAAAALVMAVGLRNRRRVPAPPPRSLADGGVAAVFRYSLWMAGLLLLNNGLRVVDVLALGRARPGDDVGRYAALAAMAAIIAIPPQALSQTLGPRVARLHAQADIAGARAALASYLRQGVLLASPLFAGLAAFGPWLDLVFGPRYRFDPWLSLILATVFLVGGCFGQMGLSLTMTGRHRQEFAVLLAGSLLAVILCWTLAPRYGGIGAALGVLTGTVASNGGRMALAARVLGGFGLRWRSIAAAPAACLVLAVGVRMGFDALFPHGWALAIGGAATAAAGFAVLYAVLLSAEEKRALLGASWRR